MDVNTLSLHFRDSSSPIETVNVGDLLEQERLSIVNLALTVISYDWKERGQAISSPIKAIDYFNLQLANEKQEVFAVLFLDNRHRVITYEALFRGTLNGASVHPRVVAQKALENNAAAVIIAHNHPSGVPEPSEADIAITTKLIEALHLIDVKLLDHLVIAMEGFVSLSDRGLI